tara:strand:- start:15 stop:605 length:591 start_codon:yes stop_codon:yes gene_type:complete
MAVSRKLGKNIKDWQILAFLGLLVLGYVLYEYSSKKNMILTNYQGVSSGNRINPAQFAQQQAQQQAQATQSSQGLPQAVDPLRDDLNAPALVNTGSASVSTVATVGGVQKSITNPSDLLPKDANSTWANSLPNNELQNVNLLNAGQHIGINTIGTNLRNSNLQLRAEPVIQKTANLCPWNMSTIEPNSDSIGIKVC